MKCISPVQIDYFLIIEFICLSWQFYKFLYTKKASKKFNTIRFSEKAYNIATQKDKMKTHEYIEIANKRAGIEGIPSVLRRRYKIDTIPIRGLLRSKLWVGFKIAAYNFKKLVKQFLERGIDYVFNAILSIFSVTNN